MRRWAVFAAAVLMLIAIGCVPGRLGVVDVGAVIPPMPLKTTPETLGVPVSETYLHRNAIATPTPTPVSPTPGPGEPVPLPLLPLVPDRSLMH